MKVRCINNTDCEDHLNVGEVYDAEYPHDTCGREVKSHMRIIGNMTFYSDRFQIVHEKEHPVFNEFLKNLQSISADFDKILEKV